MDTKRKRTLARAVAIAALVAAVPAMVPGPSAARAAGLLIADGGSGGVLEIREHTADVTINNGIAVTRITQIFRNTENRQVEALYTFPVPKDASVANFSMWIGGKEMIGEVVEKRRAREIYDSYKKVRRDPGLLEQTDYKTFEMRIFPIGPGADQKVRIAYYQELDCDHDRATFVYPLATASRPGPGAGTAGRFALTVRVKSEAPIVAVESPSHGADLVVARHGASCITASLEQTGGDLNRDVVLAYRISRPRTGLDLIASGAAGEDGYFCLTLTAGKQLEEQRTAMDYLFILDISGSMAHGGKLRMSRETIGAFLTALRPEDRFEVVTFNVAPATLFGSLTPAGEAGKARALDFLESRQARGGTRLRPALEAAYRYADPDRPLNVVVLSDGMTEQEERDQLVRLIRSRPAGARVFCVGVGNEVNRPLLKQLAEGAGGLAAFLSRGDDFQHQAAAFRRKLTRPVIDDLRIEFDGDRVYDTTPAELPSLYHGSPVRLYGRYRGHGPIGVTVRGDVDGRTFDKRLQVALPQADGSNPEIERMWAWRRVEELLRAADATGSRGQAAPEVVRLGQAYSIATEFTSFIVLENDAEYRRWRIQRRNALRLERDRKAHRRLEGELEAMRKRAEARLGPKRSAPQALGPVLSMDPPRPVAPRPQQPPSGPDTDVKQRRRGWDFSLPSRGGGPIGPAGLVVVAALAAGHLLRRRRRPR